MCHSWVHRIISTTPVLVNTFTGIAHIRHCFQHDCFYCWHTKCCTKYWTDLNFLLAYVMYSSVWRRCMVPVYVCATCTRVCHQLACMHTSKQARKTARMACSAHITKILAELCDKGRYPGGLQSKHTYQIINHGLQQTSYDHLSTIDKFWITWCAPGLSSFCYECISILWLHLFVSIDAKEVMLAQACTTVKELWKQKYPSITSTSVYLCACQPNIASPFCWRRCPTGHCCCFVRATKRLPAVQSAPRHVQAHSAAAAHCLLGPWLQWCCLATWLIPRWVIMCGASLIAWILNLLAFLRVFRTVDTQQINFIKYLFFVHISRDAVATCPEQCVGETIWANSPPFGSTWGARQVSSRW